MKHKFQVGDRVRIISDHNTSRFQIGDTGTVCNVLDDNSCNIGVASDAPSGGHHCDGTCQMGYGWWVPRRHLELIEEESVEDELVDLDDLL